METDIQREAISAWLSKGEIEKALSIGLHGAPELRRDEKRHYLGEFRERVITLLSKKQVVEPGVYPEIVKALEDKLLFNNLLKMGFHRVRPNLYFIKETGYSFPSGHAMVTLVFYGTLLYFAFRHIPSRSLRSLLTVLAIFLILAIGVSLVYLGVHYPSDVLGSYLAGFCWLVISIIIIKRLHCTRLFFGSSGALGAGKS